MGLLLPPPGSHNYRPFCQQTHPPSARRSIGNDIVRSVSLRAEVNQTSTGAHIACVLACYSGHGNGGG